MRRLPPLSLGASDVEAARFSFRLLIYIRRFFEGLSKHYILRNRRVPYDVVNDAFQNSFLNLAFRARSPRPNAKLILHSFFNFDFAFSAAARPRMPFRVPISFSGALCIAIPVVSAGLGARTHLQRGRNND